MAVGQCPTPVVHDDDGCVDDFSDVLASPRLALVVRFLHLESPLRAGDHGDQHCLLSEHNTKLVNLVILLITHDFLHTTITGQHASTNIRRFALNNRQILAVCCMQFRLLASKAVITRSRSINKNN